MADRRLTGDPDRVAAHHAGRNQFIQGYDTWLRAESDAVGLALCMSDTADQIRRVRFPRASCDVSVVLCTCNGERWITEQLASIATQTLRPDELVVQDDQSEDGTVRLVEEFARSAPFAVRLEVNPRRVGSTANFAMALARSGGRFIALADQDDVWWPSKLERLVRELEQDPTITMAFSDAELIDESGRVLARSLWDTRLIGRTLRRRPVVPEELFARRALTTGCTMVVRRRAVAAALPFPDVLADEVAPMRHDRWLSLIAAAVGTVRALPEPLLAFRVHPAQETGVLVGSQLRTAMARAALDVARRTDSDRGLHVRADQLDAAAKRAERVGDFEEADVLRSIADHLRRRVDTVGSTGVRLGSLVSEIRSGSYGRDRLGVGAATADLVRVLIHPRKSPSLGGESGS